MKHREYRLQIRSARSQDVANIIGVGSDADPGQPWCLYFIEDEAAEPFHFVPRFLEILAGKYELLEKIGVARSDISAWILYGYDQQCNMKFSPDDMKNLGESGIALCVSCWDNSPMPSSGISE